MQPVVQTKGPKWGEPRVALDEKDRQILRDLQEDGRISNAELARRIGLSAPSTLQRIRKLEESGLIDGFHCQLNRVEMGYGLLVIALVSLSLHQDQAISRFREAVTSIEQVQECLHISGEHDFLLKIVVPDMNAYRDFIDQHLSQVQGIGKIHSCFVLGVDKETRNLPV